MKQLLKRIQTLQEKDLQQVMRAVEKRYAQRYPEWDVYYIALPKDPVLRQQQIAQISQLVANPPEIEAHDYIIFPAKNNLPMCSAWSGGQVF